MVEEVAIYLVVHQPRRIKLPAQLIPQGASVEDIEKCLFDERLNQHYFDKVTRYCYIPATDKFLELVEKGMKISISFSVSFLEQAMKWGEREVLPRFRELVGHPNVELIGMEPYHSFIFLWDIDMFVKRMEWARNYLTQLLSKKPTVSDTTEMYLSNHVYFALQKAGFEATFMDGRPWVLGWREATYLYNYSQSKLKILVRHHSLSDDVGYRFSNRHWSHYPLTADTYATWIQQTRGDFVFLGWDYETFGEHHSVYSGIFDFLEWLPVEFKKRGISFATPSQLVQKYASSAHDLPLPEFGSTWAGSGGMEFFLGNPAQQAILRLMMNVYNKAKLTGNEKLVDIALWLAQSDNLHLIQWYGGGGGSEAAVSQYFTPQEWFQLSPDGIIWHQQQVYKNAIRAMDYYIHS